MNSPDSKQQLMSLPDTLAQADAMYQQARYEDASNLYQQALVMLERQGGDNSPEIAHVLQKLADSYHAINRFRESLPLYERLLAIGRQLLGPKHPDVIMLVFKIARTQELIGSFGEARTVYEQLIPLARSSLAPGHELVKQIEARFNGLLGRIDENKRAAQAWRESTVMRTSGPPASGELPGMPPLPASSPFGSGPPSSQPLPTGPTSPEAAGGPPSSAGGMPQVYERTGGQAHNSIPEAPLGAPAGQVAGSGAPPQSGAGSPVPSGQPGFDAQFSGPSGNPSIGPGGLLVPSAPSNIPLPVNSSPPSLGPNEPSLPPSPIAALSSQIAASSSAPGSFPNDSGVLSLGNGFERPMTQSGPGGMPPGMVRGGGSGGMSPVTMPGGGSGGMSPATMPGGGSGGMSPATMPGGGLGEVPPGMMQGGGLGGMPSGFMQGGGLGAPPGMPGATERGVNPGDQGGFKSVDESSFTAHAPGFGAGAPGLSNSPSMFSGPASPQQQNQPMSLVAGVFGSNAPFPSPPQPQSGDKDPWGRGPVPPPKPSPRDSAKIFIGSSPDVARSGAPPEDTPGGPKLDPYLSHLVKKVAGLKGEEVEETKPARRTGADSGWHDASVSIPPATREVLSNSKRMLKPSVQASLADEFDEDNPPTFVEDEQEYDRRGGGRSKSTARTASSRSVANKSEGMVSTVRAFKEYLIPVAMLIFLIGGGYAFMRETGTPAQLKTNPGLPVSSQTQTQAQTQAQAQAGGPVTIYSSSDGQMQLSLSSGNKAIFGNGKTAMEAPYVVYDGSWSTVAMQAVDSLMECQYWFNEFRDVMQTENGTNLYSQKSPNWTVLQKARSCMETARMWWKARQQYPAQPRLVASTKEFIYTNPFTGQTKPIPIQAVNNNVDLKGTFLGGGLLSFEKPFERGEIRAYAVRATADTETGTGTAFFVRAADDNAELFSTSDPGVKLFWGETRGKDESTYSKTAIESRQVFRPEKPTKIWLARNQALPIFILYHSVPITIGVLSFLLFWRSMMVMPGQTMDNSTNKVFRTLSMIGIFLTLCSGAIQLFLWK